MSEACRDSAARLIEFDFSPIGLAVMGMLLQMSGTQLTIILLV